MDLNIKVIGNDIHTSVYDKRDDFGFPIVNFPWLSGDVPRLPSYGIYISQLVWFARCCTSVFDFHSKNLQITSKLLTQGYRYYKLRKTFGKFFRSYSELLSKFGAISFQEYVSKGITHPVFYGDLVYKLRRIKNESNFISSGSKIVKRLRRRQYDPEIIERTIGLVLGPFTALYRSFLKRCTLTNKAVGTTLMDVPIFKVCQTQSADLSVFVLFFLFFILFYFSLQPPASLDFSVISQPISMKFGMLIVLDETNRLNIFSSQ